MSLNYKFTEIKNWKDVVRVYTNPKDKEQGIGYLNPITNWFIWQTMRIKLHNITEKNVNEWWWRINFIKRIDGEEYTKIWNNEEVPGISYPDIVQHIGLETNTYPSLTRKQFIKCEMDILERDVNYTINSLKKEFTKKQEKERANAMLAQVKFHQDNEKKEKK